jgi:dienelactone hydrolase
VKYSATGISDASDNLAQYIANSNAPAGIVLVGYSMGGLVARGLLAKPALFSRIAAARSPRRLAMTLRPVMTYHPERGA